MEGWAVRVQMSPIFTSHVDGRVTVDEWRSPIEMAAGFIKEIRTLPSPKIRADGDLVIFTVSNGRAIYRVVGEDTNAVTAILVEGTIQ